jgi:two-component system cell cycle response regulator CtrA
MMKAAALRSSSDLPPTGHDLSKPYLTTRVREITYDAMHALMVLTLMNATKGGNLVRVLLVADDFIAARGVIQMLQADGGVVDHVATGEEGLELARRCDYDIVLLDLMLPDIEGFEVVRRMRSSRNETLVLILSGLSRPQAKVKGLGLGADDFISKPFDKAGLLARMQALVRRSKGYSQPSLRVGSLLLNLGSHEVAVDDQPVHLTGKEYAILELLVLRKGMVVSKEGFLNHLYGGMDEPEMKIIDVFICKLRKKLATAGADNLIGTVWGRGYMIREPSSDRSTVPQEAATQLTAV